MAYVTRPSASRNRDLIFIGVLGAAAFVTAFALGSTLILATGIPATGGMANIFPVVYLLVLGFLICPRPYFGTMALLVVFVLAVPTVIGGPLGPLKIVSGLVIGLTWDIIIALGGRRKSAIIVASGVAATVSLLAVYVGLLILRLPAVEMLEPLLLPLATIQAVLGVAASYLAIKTYDRRVAKWPSVKRFQRVGD